MLAVLISTYEMGHQPFGLASPAAWLRAAGWDVQCLDLAKQQFPEDPTATADLVAFYLPMHTASRLAAPIIEKVRQINPSASICAYGLYAPLSADRLRSLGVDVVLGGEFEADLTDLARSLATTGRFDSDFKQSRDTSSVPRLRFLIPDRSGLPPLDRYATLQMPGGDRKIAGYTEASRGCKHLCRHCPIVPVYNGQFRTVAVDIVLADIAAQVGAGARHITFGDPDFFNGPTHARRVVEALHAAHPEVTYDVTVKIEHLLRYRSLLPRLRETGCLFVTSAVESIDDRVLALLEKGHTRRDLFEAVSLCRDTGVTLVPTFVAFHPWITLEGYCDLLDTVDELGLVEHVAPIQLAMRLLIPQGSRLLQIDEIRHLVGPFDPVTLTYPWSHADRRVDALQQEISTLVGVKVTVGRWQLFDEISELAHLRAGVRRASSRPARDRATVPYMNEPWYC
jgi:radical SAM superfamily enzyme YgiQ (UPF0313 family)